MRGLGALAVGHDAGHFNTRAGLDLGEPVHPQHPPGIQVSAGMAHRVVIGTDACGPHVVGNIFQGGELGQQRRLDGDMGPWQLSFPLERGIAGLPQCFAAVHPQRIECAG